MSFQTSGTIDEQESLFRELADFAPVMIWRAPPNKMCDWFNKPWLDFVGRPMEKELGNGWAENVHKDDFDRCLQTYVSAFDAREKFTMTYRMRRHDGVYRLILDNGAPFYRNGAFAGYFGSCIDVTDQTEAEEQLRQAHKMDALGKLTGGVAHDFNNVLQIIGGSLSLLDISIAGNIHAEARVKQAQEAVKRGAKLASQLLSYARRQPLTPVSTDIGRLIRNLDDMLRRTLGEGVEIKTVVSDELWATMVDPPQLETAILNLAVNARDAMSGHGKLTIEAENAVLDDRHASQQLDMKPGEYVMLAVSDTGSGMTSDVIQKAFDPFFTTKREGEGTGLGLSMVHGLVKQLDGHIKIYSEVGSGTTIRVYLPRTRKAVEKRVGDRRGNIVGGKETVLIVEDDDDVQTVNVAMVSALGYNVLKASDADKALVILESGVHVDLLFTDVVLPGVLRSPELARIARQKLPNIAVLFTSGYTDNALFHGGRLDPGVELLSKPFGREELALKLRQLLRQRENTPPTN